MAILFFILPVSVVSHFGCFQLSPIIERAAGDVPGAVSLPTPPILSQDKFPDTERLSVTQIAVAKQPTLLGLPPPPATDAMPSRNKKFKGESGMVAPQN